jgi:hypothetical protein
MYDITGKFYRVSRHSIKPLSAMLIVFSLLLTGCQAAAPSSPASTITSAPIQSFTSTPDRLTQPTSTATSSPKIEQTSTPAPAKGTSQQSSVTPSATNTPVEIKLATAGDIKTVFLIVMENHNWSSIINNPSAPYINQTLLPQASYAFNYHNPPGNHPSEPNYLWLEAGTNFGVHNDSSVKSNHQSSTNHLVTYLNNAGFTWKAYEEGINGKICPLEDVNLYAAKHNPMVFFDDVTDHMDLNSAYCIAHERPFSELAADLKNNMVAQYNFITPNLCNDMHDSIGCPTLDQVKNGDTWLSEQVPMILASNAYQQGGVLLITWDESDDDDQPIGMIVLSPLAKGGGYSNSLYYTHSSTLRTIQEIFNVKPFLGDAVNATDLNDLFRIFP